MLSRKLVLVLGLLALLTSFSFGFAKPRHHHRRHHYLMRHHRVVRYHHRRHHRWTFTRSHHHAVGSRVSIKVAIPGDLTAIFNMLGGSIWDTRAYHGDQQIEIANPSTADYIEANRGNLNTFGTGKIAEADILRFTEPSMVFDHATAHPSGLMGMRRNGWSSGDEVKEGRFEADVVAMTLRSMGKGNKE